MSSEKKLWTMPQLIVLTRGTPEERVLLQCKHKGSPANPTLNRHEGCKGEDINKNCAECEQHGVS